MTDEELLKEIKERLENYKKTLNDLELLNGELMNVNKKLEESEKLKSHFISNIRNEIINPFSSIIGLSKQLINTEVIDKEKVVHFAGMIYNEAFELDFQLKNIFAAASIEAGDLEQQIVEIDVPSFFNNAVKYIEQRAISKNLVIKLDYENTSNSTVFKTDADKLNIIIINLLANAIEFSKEESSEIVVKVKQNNESILFSVKDYGTGIPKDKLDIIFDRFKRLNMSIHTSNKGYGLGLSITKEYVEILGGEINVESEVGKGSTFNLFIPESNIEKPRLGFVSDNAEFFDNESDSMIF